MAVCPDSHDIILECTTENDIADCEELPEMGEHLPSSVQCGFGDGAYDTEGGYRVFHELGIEGIVPPQSNAILHDEKSKPWMRLRNDALREITGLGGDADGRRLWKHLRGYHRRSLAETAMYRFKQIFGGRLSSRKDKNQRAEVYFKCLVLNRINSIGLPKGVWIYS